jgi:molecular chaperone GrpE
VDISSLSESLNLAPSGAGDGREHTVDRAAKDARPATGEPSAAQTGDEQIPDDGNLDAIHTRLALLNSLVSESVRLGRDRERILDQLHQENQSLRAGELERAIAPVLRDLVRLRDDMAAVAARARRTADASSEPLAREMGGFCESVVDILFRQGCEPYAPAVGDRFDPREHRPSSVRESPVQEVDACIAEVVKPGFRHHSRILRPAHVIVNRFQPVPDAGEAGIVDASPAGPSVDGE